MLDVARHAGVSTMTVSRVLRNENLVSEQTRIKVRRAIEELGYVLDMSAGALSSRRTGFVACTVPSLNNSNFSDTARGITESLQEADLQLILAYTDYSMAQEERVVEALLRRRPDAFIVTGGNHTKRTRRMLQASQIPVVQMWDTPKQPIEHVVGFSNAHAIAELVNYLHQRGYRRMGFIGGSTNRDTRGADRRHGFKQAVSALDLPDDRLISFGTPPISIRQGSQALVQILERWPDTEVVLFVSDLPAVGALAECTRRGWSVPGRVAIAGFGDFEIAAHTYPAITTVSVDCYGIGASVGQIIKQAITAKLNHEHLDPELVLVEHKVLAREST
jgi:LacI family gluconate utilization system Gnt-I transcriptional repressor